MPQPLESIRNCTGDYKIYLSTVFSSGQQICTPSCPAAQLHHLPENARTVKPTETFCVQWSFTDIMSFEGILALRTAYAVFSHSFDILEEQLSSSDGGRQVPTHPAIAVAWPHITGSSSYSKCCRSLIVPYLLLSLLFQFKLIKHQFRHWNNHLKWLRHNLFLLLWWR